MEKQIAQAYPTPIGIFQIPECGQVNQALRQVILAREQAEPSASRANVGGWHSRDDLLDWPHPEIGVLRGWIAEGVAHMLSNTGGNQSSGVLRAIAWANVSRRGNYHRMHNHSTLR